MTDDDTRVDSAGFVRRSDGRAAAEYVDQAKTGVFDFPDVSVICLRLCQTSEGMPVWPDATAGVQVLMTEQTARDLAHQLLAIANELRGDGHVRQ